MKDSRFYLQTKYNTSTKMGKTSKGTVNAIKTIGNSLMVLSIVSLLIIFFPIIKDEFLYHFGNVVSTPADAHEFSIQIPKVKIYAPIIKNIDPWDKSKYLPVLQKGVAHASGSALPNKTGTIFLFSHSSDYPWKMTRYNTAFYRLGKVQPGDEIILTFEGLDYRYHVVEKKIVWPSEVEYIIDQEKDQLILQTCTPIATDFKRLLVFAEKNS